MAYLLDTNLLVQLADTQSPFYAIADRAVVILHRQGEVLHLTPQVLIEFRSVATRPKAVNGLEMTVVEVESLVATYEAVYPLLPETPDIFPAWKALVSALGVVGKQVHDARLVAVCHVHGVAQLLTFNTPHFTRFATAGPGITVVHPSHV